MNGLYANAETLARLDALLAKPHAVPVGVLGLGVAGRAMVRHLVRRGYGVIAADRCLDLDVGDLVGDQVEVHLGELSADVFDGVAGLMLSPGVHPKQPAVEFVRQRGLPIFGELELVGKLPVPVIAVTGTNGKSTTVALIGHLLQALGKKAFVGGNFGEPIVSWLDRGAPDDIVVLEVSSYQLETAFRFQPNVAVVLNITPDHLERYASIEHYAAAKARIVQGLSKDGVAILNWDDARVRQMAELSAAPVRWFSTHGNEPPAPAACLDGDNIATAGEKTALSGLSLQHGRLLGRHNRENALAALLAVAAVMPEATGQALKEGYRDFAGLPHRLQVVDEVDGILFVNDSKATNDDAAAIGVGAMQRPTVLLLGGVDKGAGYALVKAAVASKLRAVVVFGAARPVIAEEFADVLECHLCAGFTDAFHTAVQLAQPGDVVLLSPACASFDEFQNYAARGAAFQGAVAEFRQGRQALRQAFKDTKRNDNGGES